MKARSNPAGYDPARLHEAMVFAAELMDRYGEACAPIFERLADEWEAHERKEGVMARAQRMLASQPREGGIKAIGGGR